MLYKTCIVQVQPRKHALDDADHTAPTLQHELVHTDQESLSSLKDLNHQWEIDDLDHICTMCESFEGPNHAHRYILLSPTCFLLRA